MSKIKYLVFSGGGAAGYAHGGAVLQLAEEATFSFSDLKGVAGASVGAFAALLVSLNFSPQEISDKLSSLNIRALMDGGALPQQLFRLFTQYGIYTGDPLYRMIKDIIAEKTGRTDPENVTFADLKALGCKDLYIVTTKVYKENNHPTGKEKIFSTENTPQTPVAATLLASMSAPGLFRRVRLKKIAKGHFVLDEQGDLFEDGGIVNNFPIDIFDKPKYVAKGDAYVNSQTLGLALLNHDQISLKGHALAKTVIGDNHPIDYSVGLFNMVLFNHQQRNLSKKVNRQRTVQIDRMGVSLGDFALNTDTKASLIASGRRAVQYYFNEHQALDELATQPANFADFSARIKQAERAMMDAEPQLSFLQMCHRM